MSSMYEAFGDESQYVITRFATKVVATIDTSNLRSHLRRLIAEAVTIKEPLAKKLKLDSDMRARVPVSDVSDLINHPLYLAVSRFASLYTNSLDPADAVAGKTSDSYGRVVRLGKHLTANLPTDRWAGFLESNSWLYRDVPHEWNNAIAQLVAFAKSLDRTRMGVVSMNPLDMLMCSEQAPAFDDDSCFRIRGQYANAMLQHVLTPGVGIVFTIPTADAAPKTIIRAKKFSRAWLYVLKDGDAILLGRNYGSMQSLQFSALGKYVANALADPEYPYEIKPGYSDDWIDIHRDAIYGDSEMNWSATRQGVEPSRLNIEMAAAWCLSCGGRHYDGGDSNSALICNDCDSNDRCAACGDGVNDSDYRTFDGDIYCLSCFNDRFAYCEHCEDSYRNDDLTTAQGRYGEIEVCADCLRDKYEQCARCEEYYRKSAMIEIDKAGYRRVSYCTNCAYKLGSCDVCKDRFEDEDLFGTDDKVYCADCRPEEGHEEEEEEKMEVTA